MPARMVADNIRGRDRKYSGTLGLRYQGRSLMPPVPATVASPEGKTDQYHKIYLHPGSHASYYRQYTAAYQDDFTQDGTLLGVGRKGVDKRIDVISTAMCR